MSRRPLSGSCSRGVPDPVSGGRGARAGPCGAAARQPTPINAAPAHVAHVEGAATLERDGRAESALLNMPLLSGDRLRTATGASKCSSPTAARCTSMRVDDRRAVGRAGAAARGPPAADTSSDRPATVSYRIDSPVGAVSITQPGEYRVALLHGERETQLELAVVRGAAEIFTRQGSTPVRAGERAYASAGSRRRTPTPSTRRRWDDVRSLVGSRRDVRRGVSAQYLPSEVQAYAPVLDERATGATTSRTATSGIRASRPAGVRITTAAGLSYPRYGWTWIGAIASPGRRITTVAGASPPASGSGFRRRAGRRRTCRGRMRPAT